MWIADAHRYNGKRFVVRADEKLLGKRERIHAHSPVSGYKQKWPPKKDGHSCLVKLFLTAYLLRKRRAIPSAPSAAPSNIIVAPPSGTLSGGITWGAALALWLNASIRTQTATETSASLFETVFGFIDFK
jgi:hypothetical protein